jgi:hypothetical protein
MIKLKTQNISLMINWVLKLLYKQFRDSTNENEFKKFDNIHPSFIKLNIFLKFVRKWKNSNVISEISFKLVNNSMIDYINKINLQTYVLKNMCEQIEGNGYGENFKKNLLLDC